MSKVLVKRVQEGDRMLTCREAADVAGLKESTMRRWIWSRRIRSYRFGRAVRVSLFDIMALASEMKPVPQ